MFCQKTRIAQYYTPSFMLGARPRGRATLIIHVYTVGLVLHTDLSMHPSLSLSLSPSESAFGLLRFETKIYKLY